MHDPKTLAQAFTAEAISAAVSIMRDPHTEAATRLRAVSLILAQGHGTPTPRPPEAHSAKDVGRVLAGMSDAQLLEVAHAARLERHRAEGGGEQNGGPQAGGVLGGPQPIASSPMRIAAGEGNATGKRDGGDGQTGGTPHPLKLQKTRGGGQNGTHPQKTPTTAVSLNGEVSIEAQEVL